jgi:hypothetical protein
MALFAAYALIIALIHDADGGAADRSVPLEAACSPVF